MSVDDTSRLHVAVLEDDAELRDEILVPQLESCGFWAEGFAVSVDFARRMDSNPFQLLVLDIGLGDEYGLDVAHRLRADSPIGIVALTGRDGRD
jgi:DNA-binding response OmpR family regulator